MIDLLFSAPSVTEGTADPVAAPPSPRPLLTIDRAKGRGPLRFLCVPGLVPDGPETFLRQRKLLAKFGPADVVTYPPDRFDLDRALAEMEAYLREDPKVRTVLVGVSVGGGLCLELLRRAREAKRPLPLHGVVLISPLTCTADLSPILSKLLAPILTEMDKAEAGRPEVALERGRSFFKGLASRSAGTARAQQGWRKVASLFTPAGLAELVDGRIRKRIEATLDRITPAGAVQRVEALRRLPGLGVSRTPYVEVPTLLLWGAKERHTLDMDGPGTRILCRPDLAVKVFPKAEVHWIYDKDGEEVPHASLLRHAKAFNRPLKRFLKRIA